jgi:purine-nucleoside phosphorylase
MAPVTEIPQDFAAALSLIKARIPAHLASPRVAIECGSGLSALADSLRDKQIIAYNELEGFGESGVHGHKSELAFGLLGPGDGVPVVMMLGRFHTYEGHSPRTVVFPIRLFALLGVKNMIVTNAAGSLNPKIKVGTIVVVQDHLALPNLTGYLNPLFGPVLAPPFDPRFVPLSAAYSFNLRKHVFQAAHALGLERSALEEGTYAWVSGPTYESPAEGRFLRNQGADVVGMSTVPEVVAAHQAGMQVLVLSLVTNIVIIPDKYRSPREEFEAELAGKPAEAVVQEEVSHLEVIDVAAQKGPVIRQLVEAIVGLVD